MVCLDVVDVVDVVVFGSSVFVVSSWWWSVVKQQQQVMCVLFNIFMIMAPFSNYANLAIPVTNRSHILALA